MKQKKIIKKNKKRFDISKRNSIFDLSKQNKMIEQKWINREELLLLSEEMQGYVELWIGKTAIHIPIHKSLYEELYDSIKQTDWILIEQTEKSFTIKSE